MASHALRRNGVPPPALAALETAIRRIVGALLIFPAVLAAAHPALLSSSPKSGDALGTPPGEVRLRFNEPIEAAFTTVKVVDASGNERAANGARADPNDAHAIVVPIEPLAPGAYRAMWSAMGRDGHRVKGEFSFSVK
jgi:methionine-rich copper-binding protein CopC